MQRIPTLYGFSIIILVLVLMIINHVIYMEILERSLQEQATLNTVEVVVPEKPKEATESSEIVTPTEDVTPGAGNEEVVEATPDVAE